MTKILTDFRRQFLPPSLSQPKETRGKTAEAKIFRIKLRDIGKYKNRLCYDGATWNKFNTKFLLELLESGNFTSKKVLIFFYYKS